ncbi:hypothetical protein MN608_06625 [Microdochium nivale]|nr:hypothetical protein MN608_06625 [Microdochium nivale]
MLRADRLPSRMSTQHHHLLPSSLLARLALTAIVAGLGVGGVGTLAGLFVGIVGASRLSTGGKAIGGHVATTFGLFIKNDQYVKTAWWKYTEWRQPEEEDVIRRWEPTWVDWMREAS